MVLGGEATSRTSDETLTARLSLANIFMQSDQFDQAEGIYMQLARTMFFWWKDVFEPTGITCFAFFSSFSALRGKG